MLSRNTDSMPFLISILLSFQLSSASPHQIDHLARQINDSEEESNLTERQYKLLDLLREERQLEIARYNEVIAALERKETFPDFNKKCIATIDKCMKILWQTPGFIKNLHSILTNLPDFHAVKGPLCELEVALAIVNLESQRPWAAERILRFNRIMHSTKLGITREFDIETTHTQYEIKNINWHHYPLYSRKKSVCKLQEQLLDQKKLIDELNDDQETSIVYTLYSKNPIPTEWQAWLEEEEITYISGDFLYH